MNLKTHYAGAPGYTELVTPATHPVEYLHFGMLALDSGQEYTTRTADQETGLVILRGRCDITVDGELYPHLGGRASVFDGRASGLYAPPGAAISVRGGPEGVEAAVCRCRTDGHHPVQVVRPEDVLVREVGGPAFRRY